MMMMTSSDLLSAINSTVNVNSWLSYDALPGKAHTCSAPPHIQLAFDFIYKHIYCALRLQTKRSIQIEATIACSTDFTKLLMIEFLRRTTNKYNLLPCPQALVQM